MIRRKLSEIENGKTCKVVECMGGLGMMNKLDSLGIRLGKEIVIINGSFLGGPSTVMAGSTRIAIGKNMAKKIVVEVDE